MEYKICSSCGTYNPQESSFCRECGKTLEIIKTNKPVCPICKVSNSIDSCYCVECGQRLKINYKSQENTQSTENMELNRFYEEYVEYESKKRKKKSKYILITLAIFLMSIIYFHQDIYSNLKSVINPSIKSVQGITVTVQQNTEIKLPLKAKAEMSFGDNQSVDIKWNPEKIDTATAGTKIAKGTIKGYPGIVYYTVNIVTNKTFKRIEDCTVNNSLVEIDAEVPTGCKWIWISITKGTEKRDTVLPVINGILSTRIYLPFNDGEYKIRFTQSSNEKQNSYYFKWKEFNVTNTDTRDMLFLLPEQYVDSDSPEIISLASQIVLGLKTDKEKTLAIHDYVATNIAYDTVAYFNNDLHNYSALETLHGKKAICNGYANLTAALNRAIGIRTKIIGGTAWNSTKTESHAWNETYIDGKWLIQDTTWDAGGVVEGSKKFKFYLSHQYFNPTLVNFEKNHKKTSER